MQSNTVGCEAHSNDRNSSDDENMLPNLIEGDFDFVLAADSDSEQKEVTEDKREIYFTNLKAKGLEVLPAVHSNDGQTAFWRVRANLEALYDVAEELNEYLPTEPNDIYQEDDLSNRRGLFNAIVRWWKKMDPFKSKNEFHYRHHYSYSRPYFASRFDHTRLSFFQNGDDPKNLFTPSQRSRFVFYILENPKSTLDGESESGDMMGISHLIAMNIFTAAYPCHETPFHPTSIEEHIPVNDRQILSLEWASFKRILKYQPIELVKNYFGIKVAFYFRWLGFYTTCLIPATIVGLLCMLYGIVSMTEDETIQEICNSTNNKEYMMCPLCDRYCPYYSLTDYTCFYARITHIFDNNATPFFAVFMSLWSVIYLELWKRRQCKLLYNWHINEYVDHEAVRPEFVKSAQGTIRNPVTGKLEPAASRCGQALKIMSTCTVVFFFIALVVASVAGVIIYRAAMFSVHYLHNFSSEAFGSNSFSKLFITITGAALNLLVINVSKFGYHKLAIQMTFWENPRTQSDFEKSYTLKLYCFQFCNNYASLFYVAFFKSEFFTGWPGNYRRVTKHDFRLEGCSDQGCFLELCIQIFVIMVGQQFLGNIVEIGWPYMKRKYNGWKRKTRKSILGPIWESDYQLSDNSQLSLVWEYQEVVIQYGFVTLFVAAFPLAPLIALFTNIVEIRIDAINMLNAFRRPVASHSPGIGIWSEILWTVTHFSVLVNGFVLSFASEFIPRQVYLSQYSPDGTMKGYVDWSLSHFNVTDFTSLEKPMDSSDFNNFTHCRYRGHHQPVSPYDYNTVHYKILSLRLLFAFVFQWFVTAACRVLAWTIRDTPRSVELSMKRETFLNREAMRVNRVEIQSRLHQRRDGDGD